MSYIVARSVRGPYVAIPSAEPRDGTRVYDTQSEAEKRCRELNRRVAADLATQALDLAFGYEPEEEHLK